MAETLAEALRRRRQELGQVQSAAAVAIGCGQDSVSKWEKGSIPAPRWFEALIAYLDLEADPGAFGLLLLNGQRVKDGLPRIVPPRR